MSSADTAADAGAPARTAADRAWLDLGGHVFRLPGIYGPGRSALDRVLDGRARLVAVPGQIFSRVHVDDIVSGVIAGFAGPSGAYNLADDRPASQNEVIAFAAQLTRARHAAASFRSTTPLTPWRAIFTRRTAASRMPRRSGCSAGRRFIQITGRACAPSAR